MGHRERLLAAARRCLVELGYSRTTARDLVAASGTNLASIGYHFGSKEALLAEALDEVFVEYTEKVLALAGAVGGAVADPAVAVQTAWIAMTDLQDEYRPVLVAFIEALAQAERSPTPQARLAAGYEQMRRTIVEGIAAVAPGLEVGKARAVASFFMAVSDGYMLQWLLDPAATPSGADLLEGARQALTPLSAGAGRAAGQGAGQGAG